MSERGARPAQHARRALLAIAACVPILGIPAVPARAETNASITASLSPDRLRARAALTVTIRLANERLGVPEPMLHSSVRFPAGMSIEIPALRSCSAAHLRAHGARGCPPQSLLGHGYALAEVLSGSQTVTEHITLTVFLGPLENLQPTVEILGQGYTPYDKRMVLSGALLSAQAPYGEELVVSVPPIPTLPYEPDASIATLSFTVGARSAGRAASGSVLVPSRCPLGGFPFAAELGYAGGSQGSATTTIACPP